MRLKSTSSVLAALALLVLLAGLPLPVQARPAQAVTVPSAAAEGADFATQVLGDPWDMSEFTDVSQYLNESGQRSLVLNPTVSGGLFTGTSVGDASTGNTAAFYPLFPGYETAIQAGKVGSHFPIKSATYKCLYVAMAVNSGPANAFGPEFSRIFWFADEKQNNGPTWGTMSFPPYFADYGAGAPPANTWRLFKIDLVNKKDPDGNNFTVSGTAWDANATWKGLRIDPTINKNIAFKVDWVRLTDCAAVNKTVTFTSNASITSIYIRPAGTSNYIRVAKNVTGASGTYTLDVQGIAPGSYFIGLGTATSCCLDESASASFVVNQAPIVSFARPSFTSGPEYSELAGNPWDFKDSADVASSTSFKSLSFSGGELNMTTTSGPKPAGVDAHFHLNTPLAGSPASFRYLSFRMSSQNGSAAWQNVVDGMIARFVWSVQGASGREGYRCHLVTNDIPYDVGYPTYSIDLYDAFNGTAEEWSPPPGDPLASECDSLPKTWQGSSPALEFRFDPNENISCNPQFSTFPIATCGDYVQKLDWIKLTGRDTVTKGWPYPVRIGMNKSTAVITSRTFYYTDDLSNKTKFTATPALPTPPIPGVVSRVFLPGVFRAAAGDPNPAVVSNAVTFMWSTSSVTPGTYYICVQAADSLNTNTFCSEAPVVVQ